MRYGIIQHATYTAKEGDDYGDNNEIGNSLVICDAFLLFAMYIHITSNDNNNTEQKSFFFDYQTFPFYHRPTQNM